MKNEIRSVILTILVVIVASYLIFLAINADDISYNNQSFEPYFTQIEDNKYYYNETRIVYIKGQEVSGYKGFGYMAPYYSSNGKLCIYDSNNKKIVEINND